MNRARWAGLLTATVLLCGCGDTRLWNRWQAERSLEHARRLSDRVLVRPSLARADDWARADAAFREVTERWPASRWVGSGDRIGREIATISARAAISRVRLAELRRRDDEALAGWRAAAEAVVAMPALAAEVATAEAAALERSRRFDEVLLVWKRLAEDLPLRDPDSGWIPAVLRAPLRYAIELRSRGRGAEADTMLLRSEARLRAEMSGERGAKRRPMLEVLADAAALRRDLPTSMAVLREQLAIAGDGDRMRRVVFTMANRAFDLGAFDSALVYARWSETLGGPTAARATLLRGRAWQQVGNADSALDAYTAVTERPRDPDDLAPIARFRRGEILDGLGRWESARAEWRALQAQSPTHELAFLSMQRIVQHHLAAGEVELARLESGRTVANLERLLEINADPIVQRQARIVRAELLAETGESRASVEAFMEMWQRFPGDSIAEAAALRGARLAARAPGVEAFADSLRMMLATSATHAEIRHAAAPPNE